MNIRARIEKEIAASKKRIAEATKLGIAYWPGSGDDYDNVLYEVFLDMCDELAKEKSEDAC